MKCKKCRKVIPDDSKFCCYCGTPQAAKPKMYRRPDGLYEKVITVKGNRIYFRGKTEKEVERKMLEYQKKIEQGESFSAIAEAWFEEHSATLKPSSLNNYTPAVKRAVDFFGSTPITEIKASDVSRYLMSLPQSFAQKTMLTHLQIVNMICKYSVVNGAIETNPAEYVQIPRGRKKTRRRPSTPDEVAIIKANVDKPFGLYAFILLCTGCRRGEALALQYRDIDYVRNVIHITKSISYKSNFPNVTSTKTDNSERSVVLLDQLRDKIPSGKPDDFIFGGKEPMKLSQFKCAWKHYKDAAGLTDLTPHMVRHGYASILHEAGIDAKDAQELLGHANISTTMDIYTHITEKQRAETARKLNLYANNTQ